ncbi:MAG: cyclic nucleotide-binding domain-containing protein [Ignavibacteriales bacterium]|nr:cyclic nucleotide-binding domain-containing protein [Ignavibacteriales bacterium]
MSHSSNGSAVWKNLFSGKSIQDGSTESVLSRVPAFTDLSARELRGVAAIVHKREYKAGEPVFYQGDPGLGMYIIREGEVSIRIAEGEEDDKELAVLTDGDFFGELALLDESPRSATAICRTDCSLIGFFRTDLFEMIEQKTDLGLKIVMRLAEILAVRLRKTDKELSKLRSQLDAATQHLQEHYPLASEDHHGKDETKTAGPRSEASEAR